jgi:CheY-like chemotaxis protein
MKNVLIVEDNNTIRMMYSAGLAGMGLNVVQAKTVEQAKEQIKKTNPQVIVLDLRLPGEWGHTLIPYVRNELQRDDIPIIVASAQSTMEEEVLALGANHFVPKPIDFAVMLGLIQQYTR